MNKDLNNAIEHIALQGIPKDFDKWIDEMLSRSRDWDGSPEKKLFVKWP